MKLLSIILLPLIFLSSCDFGKISDQKVSDNKESDYNNLALKEKEKLNVIDAPGTLISLIEFNVKATGEELKDFEDGFIPWISIDKPEDEVDNLIDADKIVIPYSEITLIIDYPLNTPARFVLKSSVNGFTKKQLILEISKKYHEIYTEEENTAKTKTVPVDKRKGLINRNETDGKYGVWGHDIGDLVLSSINVFKSNDGKIQIILGVES